MLNFIKSYKIYITIAVIIFGLAGTIWYLHGRVSELEQKNGQFEATVANYKKAQENLNEIIMTQNKSIHNLRSTENELNDQLEQARKAREQQQKRYEERVRDLAQEDIPKSCTGAMEYMTDKAMEFKKNEDQ